MELNSFSDVYTIGYCASITNPFSRRPYPPTVQHAIRQGQLAVENIINNIKGKKSKNKVQWQQFRRVGVAKILGFKFNGLIVWFLWSTFYLSNIEDE